MHLNDEDLILYYYGESADDLRLERHLTSCEACREELARLQHVLSLVDAEEIPEPSPAFERTVWLRLEPKLTTRRSSWFQMPRLAVTWPHFALGGGVAALVLIAFLAGRMTSETTPVGITVATAADSNAVERVVVIAVVDHLDRSQMVLAELLNADAADATLLLGEQDRVRDLVAANRLYRQSVAQAGDASANEVLEELERVLQEIANAPADASATELDALRARIESRGLLFRVRVVQSEMRERERQTVTAGGIS
jgi:hypothetical protein